MDMRIGSMRHCIGAAALLCMLLFSAVLLPSAHAAEPTYYYISAAAGSNANDGLTADSAVQTMTKAMSLAVVSKPSEAVFVFTDTYKVPAAVSEFAHSMPFTFTTNDGKVDYGATGAKLVFGNALRFYLQGDTTFENITIEYSGTLNFVAQYNPITFGKGVVTKRMDSEACGVYIVGGWQNPAASKDVTLDSHITIESGTFYRVIGGSRQSGSSTELSFTGTHHITVNGGEIDALYSGSLQSHQSRNVVITVSGGKIDALYFGGDDEHGLHGSADATFAGGELSQVCVNNVVGDVTVSLLGAKVRKMDVSYATTALEKLHKNAGSTKTLRYHGYFYTAEDILTYTGFTDVQNNTILYAKENANGNGLSESTPASFAEAMQIAAKIGGTVKVLGTVRFTDYAEPAHREKITVVGASDNARVQISGTYTFAGETCFENLTLGGRGTLDASGGIFATADSIKLDSGADLLIKGSANLGGGTFAEIRDAKTVSLTGAMVEKITGGSTATHIEVESGSIGTLVTAESSIQEFTLSMLGGSIDKVIFRNVTEHLSYRLLGGSVSAYAVEGTNVQGELTVDESKYSQSSLSAAASLFAIRNEVVFFLCDGASGSGKSAHDASSSLTAAYAALNESGGTLVICGPYTLKTSSASFKNEKPIVITSVYNGVDYAKSNGAQLIFQTNYFCGGDTEFKDITLAADGRYLSIYGNCHKLVLGENITSTKHENSGTYLSVMGGSQSAIRNASTDLTIRSGTWQRVRGGTAANGSQDFAVNLKIEGGEFMEYLTLGSSASHDGDINAVIDGGTFYQGIYASTLTNAQHYFNSKVSLLIRGGTFYGNIAPARATVSVYLGTYSGSFDVAISGGNFDHLTELLGTDGRVKDMTSSLQVTKNMDLDAAVSGTMTFVNPIRTNGADPWLFYLDGYYYYTATTGSTLGIARATNIGDLKYAEYVTVYDPEDGKMWSRNLWSPEIHYYSDEEIGEGNGGWYCYIACDDGDNVHHRMYVVKCLDGNNLFGRWGNPLTGEVNVPQKIEAKDISGFDSMWAAGQTDIRIGGKLYMMYVTERGRYTPSDDFGQTINIVEMTNPWTIVGQSAVICKSDYEWEMGGASATKPKVVEGGTAVYADDGTIYIVYSGSGYWTTEYQLGQLKYLGGDPLDVKNWEKRPTSILRKSDEINGCGHASYVTDTSGQDWVCYHAYIGKTTESGRYAFVEPYYADKNGVVIADGSEHPAPIDTVYEVALNSMSLADKISGFDSVTEIDSPFARSRSYAENFSDVANTHWFYSYVKNAYEIGLASGTSNTTFSPDSSFTVAQALTAAANIHSIYHAKTVRAAAAGEKWYDPYVEYCIENGIITKDQFANYDANITRGDMAIVFAGILPASEYAAVRSGNIPDVTADMACASAVRKLYDAGVVGGDTGTGNYRPSDSLKRSEACVIFTRIAMKNQRAQ